MGLLRSSTVQDREGPKIYRSCSEDAKQASVPGHGMQSRSVREEGSSSIDCNAPIYGMQYRLVRDEGRSSIKFDAPIHGMQSSLLYDEGKLHGFSFVTMCLRSNETNRS